MANESKKSSAARTSRLEIRDIALQDDIFNESVSLSLNAQKRAFLKTIEEKLRRLESLLIDSNIERDHGDILALISEIDNYDLVNFRNEESAASFLHLVVDRAGGAAIEPLLMDICKRLVEKDCDVNAVDSYGWSLLHYCANFNHTDIAKFLLERKELKVETVNSLSTKQLKMEKFYFLVGTSPLQVCAWLNSFTIAQSLVLYGADIHAKNEAGWTCLHICSRQGHADFLKYLIKNGCNVNEGNNHQKTPLHVSCRHGNEKIARTLLKANAGLALRNNYGQSPLYVAVTRGHHKLVRLLLEYNADANQTDNQENNPLHACAMLKETKEELATEDGESKGPRNVQIAELLINRGANPLKQNHLGFTPLHYCSKNNCEQLATLLLNKCISLINVRNIYGETALFLACKWGSSRMERLLLAKNANRDLADLSGFSPIHLCAYESASKLLTQLLESGDDVNKATSDKACNTPLHIAAQSNNQSVVSYLISKDADVNKANKDKLTPLHVAAANGADDACLVLLGGGAKVNKVDQAGQTPLHSCIFSSANSVKIAKMLVDFGTSINQENSQNQNALAIATMAGNYELVEFLVAKKAKVINSTYESVAHLCASADKCDSRCLKLLIDTYGFEDLFSFSLSHYRTPLQISVEKQANIFLKALIACENVKCLEWCSMIHSSDGLGISPLVMAISSQNYAFVQELINMWFKKFQQSHHAVFDLDDEFIHQDANAHSRAGFLRQRLSALKSKSSKIIGVASENRLLNGAHGCVTCKKHDVCLFKPDWNEPGQTNEKYYLNILIRDNPQLTKEILNTFVHVDILKWKTYIYLDHLEPCESLTDQTDYDDYRRPLTPLETIYMYNKTDLVVHPVVKMLITEKYHDYARWNFWVFVLRNIMHLVIWTAFAVDEPYSLKHFYQGSNRAGKIVLLVLVVFIFVWDVVEEVRQFYFTLRRYLGFKKYIRNKYDELLELEKFESKSSDSLVSKRSLKRAPSQKGSVLETQRTRASALINRKTNKYSFVKKEEKASRSLKFTYIRRVDNVADCVAIVLQFVTIVLHLVDIGAHSDELARVQNIFLYLTVILIWLRQLLVVNGIFPGIDLVCMVRLIGPYIVSFGFLYMRIYIPFLLLFWALYSGARVPQQVMSNTWRECETIVYQVPYTGSQPLNTSYYSSVCEPSLTVDGFANFYDSMYSVFRMIVVDNYDFDTMKLVQNELTPILCAVFILLSSVIGLNFFIGLMSNVLSEQAYNMVESHKSMELLGYILQLEWRMSRKQRQKHLDKIKLECSPKIQLEKANRNPMQPSQEFAYKQHSHSHRNHINESLSEILKELGGNSMLRNAPSQTSALSGRADKSEMEKALHRELGELKKELGEMKELLKSKLK